MFFLAMLFLMFAFMRIAGGGRHRFGRVHCYNHHHRGQRPVQLQGPAPQPTPFERLKQRYVDGDLSDEQYEEELDKLLRVGGTARFDTGPRRADTRA
jgi:hypothetical protein